MDNTLTQESVLAYIKEISTSIDKNAKLADKNAQTFAEETKVLKDAQSEFQSKVEQAQLKTDAQLKKLGQEIGGIHRERGSYTEYILMPSIEEVILNDFKFDTFDANLRRRINDDEIQIDAIGFTNSSRNELLVVEVKTNLDSSDIKQLEKHLAKLDKFYPEHKNKKKFGLLVALHASKEMIEKVHKKGLYFASIKNDMLNLENPKGFKPKEF